MEGYLHKKRVVMFMMSFILISGMSVYANDIKNETMKDISKDTRFKVENEDYYIGVCDTLDELINGQEIALINSDLPEVEEPEMTELELAREKKRQAYLQKQKAPEVTYDAGPLTKNMQSFEKEEMKKVFSVSDQKFLQKIANGEKVTDFYDEKDYSIFVPGKNVADMNARVLLGYSEKLQKWEPRSVIFCVSEKELLVKNEEVLLGFEKALSEGDSLKEIKYFNSWINGPFVVAYAKSMAGQEWLMPIDEGAPSYSLERNKAYGFEELVESLKFRLK